MEPRQEAYRQPLPDAASLEACVLHLVQATSPTHRRTSRAQRRSTAQNLALRETMSNLGKRHRCRSQPSLTCAGMQACCVTELYPSLIQGMCMGCRKLVWFLCEAIGDVPKLPGRGHIERKLCLSLQSSPHDACSVLCRECCTTAQCATIPIPSGRIMDHTVSSCHALCKLSQSEKPFAHREA